MDNLARVERRPIFSGTIEEAWQWANKVRVMVDPTKNQCKPTDIGRIKSTICSPYNIKRIGIKELAEIWASGYTILPAILEGDGNANESMWRCQQVFPVDIDNKDVFVTMDEALALCNDAGIDPAFIYATFSYTDELPKFRMVFVTRREINKPEKRDDVYHFLQQVLSIDGQTVIDTQCFDGGRIFFGGKQILYQNYDARIDVEALLRDDGNKPNTDSGLRLVEKRMNNNKYTSYYSYKNPTLIKNKNINGLQAILQPVPKLFPSYSEAIRYLTQEVNLWEYLGVSGSSFNCIFHEDKHPSAGIIFPSKRGEYFYHCFTDSCGTQGNIIRITEFLQNEGRMKAIKFLMELYRVTIEESEPSKLLQENMRMIRQGELAEIEPEIHSIVGRYYPEILLIHQIVMDNLYHAPIIEGQEEAIFFFSNSYFAKLLGKNTSSASIRLALIAYLRLCRKLNDSEVPPEFLKRAQEFSRIHGYKETVQFYSMPSYGAKNLEISRERAIAFKENNCTIKGMSRELLFRTFGEDIANEVYPKQAGKSLSDESNRFQELVEKILFELINAHAYATEAQILAKLKGNQDFNHTRLKRMLQESLDKYDLIKRRSNQHDKKLYGIKQKGYPIIITRRSEQ